MYTRFSYEAVRNLPMMFSRSAFAVLPVLLACIAALSFAHADEASEPAEQKKVDFKTLKSPVPYTATSIRRGQITYNRYCTECHGHDGKAQIDVIADATDLTSPHLYYSGTTEGEIFRSIRDGAGINMPPYKMQIRREEELWHLVNYIRSLWPKDKQPELQEDQKESDKENAEEKSESANDGGQADE
jgi:mono/diheme cytochrome c family protein